MQVQSFACVWDALTDTPDEAADLRLRSDLLAACLRQIDRWRIDRALAADRLKLSARRFADLRAGRIHRFTSAELAELADRALTASQEMHAASWADRH
ncbi:XRE family transcriptional regulator [Sphingomonas sp. ac-8]|uniref:XRE family transcriptional regulator n=1 Tax=Sphingomonas sp. ac-8 TaxID=3242977 RepID=UPI003A8044C4